MRIILMKNSDPSANKHTLAERRAAWLECLYADDSNSIGFQVYCLTADFLDWWTINEARRFSRQDENRNLKGSRFLHRLLDRCFVATHMVAIRRLCDSSYTIDDEKKGVWSLGSLLKDLGKNSSLLTREAIFKAEGIEHDLGSNDLDALLDNADPADEATNELIGRYNRSRDRHEEIDILTGVASADRSKNDCVKTDVFGKMRNNLEYKCNQTYRKVNKFLAHSASPTSRSELKENSLTVIPNDLLEATRTINDTFDFISKIVLPAPEFSGNRVPKGHMNLGSVELFDPLEGIDIPLLDSKHVHCVRLIREEMKTMLCKTSEPRELLESSAHEQS